MQSGSNEMSTPTDVSLYDQLQESKAKKQEYYDQLHRPSNYVRGLNEYDVKYIEEEEKQQKIEQDAKTKQEELELEEFKQAQSLQSSKTLKAPDAEVPAQPRKKRKAESRMQNLVVKKGKTPSKGEANLEKPRPKLLGTSYSNTDSDA